ncbi:bifunctional indole-3-glycerol-phosphate synthase TrpC/phosphoribosylanthranilate isomerase TrpF [Aliikangiella marina]|uniref:Multifunctional fusion protein n=1 Tax=Aliikangiella marina TaxID=1712262 RepID=A0A545TED4_9GAMM|nr:bifunctional indole-3-glycerol-phosphate synthase TrpC/phosphoribosylanthranilate isomerase TrpF [Aliikangiella marina]TQV75570.1 bifunctional indole-3-glycerol-phosphate synthase TrpC/phosphoribosylanthranilate isomerase TrpF [Aliikangiella marina]
MLSPEASKRNVLEEIVNHKRVEVDLRKKRKPLVDFKAEIKPSERSLKKALSNQASDFILECKKASPSKGLIRADFNINEILDQYKDFASAISVLTDNRYFQGDFEYLKTASKRVDQPILCKDFFIDCYQVYEARHYGADAILLMLSVLDDETYNSLAQVAEFLNLDVLTEVHDQSELSRALELDAKIIGINNRDLKTLKIDLATTEKLVSKVDKDVILISESGIETYQDIKRLSPLVNGFLIGSSIMAQADMRSHCKSLLFGNVKICGLKTPQDATAVDKHGGIFGGLVFYPKSKRYIELDAAKQLVSTAPLKYVGVFVNESIEKIVNIAQTLSLFAVQLHGDETAEYIAELKSKLNQVQIWKAERISDEIRFIKNPDVNRYLLDTDSSTYGGSGHTFDWQLLETIDCTQVMLAGGINLNNAVDAVSKNVFGIDLSSGVEHEPGLKSEQKIAQLFQNLRV